MDWLIYFDLFGVFVFALSGGFDGAKYKLDMFGILVLAVATGVGGGIMRDALLGVHPPVAFLNETYVITCVIAGLIVFFFSGRIETSYGLCPAGRCDWFGRVCRDGSFDRDRTSVGLGRCHINQYADGYRWWCDTGFAGAGNPNDPEGRFLCLQCDYRCTGISDSTQLWCQ